MGLDIYINLDRGNTGGTFTNHDVITGTVKLSTTASVTLAYIQVKLEAVSATQMRIPVHRRRRRANHKVEHETVHDIHKLLYDTLIVFPPENIRKVSTAKDFTITPGTYTYPFQFRIPLKSNCSVTNGSNVLSPNWGEGIVGDGLRRNLAEINSRFQMNGPDMRDSHVYVQLPPTLLGLGDSAKINYFVKVTCKRTLLFKMSPRATDPFNFLPLDLDDNFQPLGLLEEEYKEVFFRKDVVFKNRIPEIVAMKVDTAASTQHPRPQIEPLYHKKGMFSSFFGSLGPPNPPAKPVRSNSGRLLNNQEVDVGFSFEIRFQYPARLSPTGVPQFKLFLVTNLNPSTFSLAKYGKPTESNGLGVVYLHTLKFDLAMGTNMCVRAQVNGSSSIHYSRSDKTIPICNNTYQDLAFDLMHSKRQKSSSASSNGFVDLNSYELEIPRKYYDNFQLPRDLAPTFRTCNIERCYSLSVIAGVSSEKLRGLSSREQKKLTKIVDLACPNIRVLSGLKLTQALHSNQSNPSFGASLDGTKEKPRAFDAKPVPYLPNRPSEKSRVSVGSLEDPLLPLPTYEDALRESNYQNDSEHFRVRNRYGG